MKITASLLRALACVCVMQFSTSVASAATFTPDDGTTIMSENVTVTWESPAVQQWVRAFDQGGATLFDSGRQSSSSGAVSFQIPSDSTQLKIIFYEFRGGWMANERLYDVSLQDGVPITDLICTEGQIIVAVEGGGWDCATAPVSPNIDNVASIIEGLYCKEGEELVRLANGAIGCEPLIACPQEIQTAFGYSTLLGFLSENPRALDVLEDSETVCVVVYTPPVPEDFFLDDLASSGARITDGMPATVFDFYPDGLDPDDNMFDEFEITSEEARSCAVRIGCENFGGAGGN